MSNLIVSLWLIISGLIILILFILGVNVPIILFGLVILICFFIHLALTRNFYWVLLTIFLIPFVIYLRQFVPDIIHLGGISFVVSGAVKELLAISVLIVSIPLVINKLSFRFFSLPLVIYVFVTFVTALRMESLIEIVSYLRIAYIGIIYYIIGPIVYKKPIIQYLAIMMIILGIIDSLLGLYRYYF